MTINHLDQNSYYVVANDEFIRVAYLLLYSSHSCTFPFFNRFVSFLIHCFYSTKNNANLYNLFILFRLNPIFKVTSFIAILFLFVIIAFFILNYFHSDRDHFYHFHSEL